MTEPPVIIIRVLFTVVSWLPVPLVYGTGGSVATTVNKTCKKNSNSKRVHNSELEKQIYGINRGN